MHRITTAAAALALTAIAGTAAAAEHTVCASGCDFSTIQAAVDASSPWDVLDVAAETFEESVYIDLALVIQADGATLEGDGTGPVLTVDFGADVDIEGLTLSDGGGVAGVLNYGTLTLAGCTVEDHDADYGALFNVGMLYVVGQSVVQNNQGQNYAGGITNAGPMLQVGNSTIIGNQGDLGGGIANVNGTTIVTTSSLSHNHADSIGGAWSNHNSSGTFDFDGSSSMSGNTTGSGNYTACYDVDGHAACTP